MKRRPDRWWEDPRWWEATYADQVEAREGLHAFGASAFWHLPTLVRLWLEELDRIGLTPLDESGAPPKQKGPGDPDTHARIREVKPARLDSGKVLWIRLDGRRRTKHGYKNVEISDEPLTTDVAIIAALTTLEVTKVNKHQLARLVALLQDEEDAPLEGSITEQVSDILSKYRRDKQIQDKNVKFLEKIDLRPFEYCLALLRNRYAGFDDLPRSEQLGLLKRAFSYISEIVTNAHKLAKFLEYGNPAGLPTRTLETVEKRVRAALLRDVVGLSPPELAEELGIPKPRDFEIKRDVPEARDLADQGREILQDAFGDDGWQAAVQAKKAEMQRWQSLTEEQKKIEREADLYDYEGWPHFIGERIRRRASDEPSTYTDHPEEKQKSDQN